MALFFVTAENVENGLLVGPEQLTMYINQMVIPSLQMLGKWEEEGRIKGGVLAGQRAGAFFCEAASAEDLNQMLQQLPFWGTHRWAVTPLISWRSEVSHAQQLVQQFERWGKR